MVTLSELAIPSEVREFAGAKGVAQYLNAVLALARQAFPLASLGVSLGQDCEDERHQYVAIDVDVGTRTTTELLAGQQAWSNGICRVCPSHLAVYFVLGWR